MPDSIVQPARSDADTTLIAPCLWFDQQAEAAAKFYVEIFPNSSIGQISRYGEAGRETHGGTPGNVLTVAFTLDGQPFTALNGGPRFQFSEAISLQVRCETQQEIDYYWDRLTEGKPEHESQCGWLKDRYGLSWQIVPSDMGAIMTGPGADRAMAALLKMKKLNIDELWAAAAG